MRELEKRPKLRGQSPILLPDSEGSPLQGLFQIFSQPELGLDEELLQRIRAKAGSRLSVKGYLRALRQIYAKSSEKCLAMNVFALDELRAEGDGDWGQDATAAVLAAQRAELPILFCDLPQEWTLGKVIPIYNKEWVAARGKRLKFLEDLDVATQFLQAEEAMIREAVMSGHGGDLPSLDYGLGLCRPAVGFAEAATRRLWLEERDPAMANAVTSALEGRARVLEGKHSRLEAKQRAVLQVGCCHVEGIAKSLQQHGYKVVPEPQGGWPDLTSKAAPAISLPPEKEPSVFPEEPPSISVPTEIEAASISMPTADQIKAFCESTQALVESPIVQGPAPEGSELSEAARRLSLELDECF